MSAPSHKSQCPSPTHTSQSRAQIQLLCNLILTQKRSGTEIEGFPEGTVLKGIFIKSVLLKNAALKCRSQTGFHCSSSKHHPGRVPQRGDAISSPHSKVTGSSQAKKQPKTRGTHQGQGTLGDPQLSVTRSSQTHPGLTPGILQGWSPWDVPYLSSSSASNPTPAIPGDCTLAAA